MKKIIAFLFISFIFVSSPKALECSAREKVSLSSEATKIMASYEFKTDENGANYFLITVYNLSPSTFVSYTDRNYNINSLVYSENGDPSFKDYNLDDIYKYQFDIYVNGSEGCVSKIRSFTITKPKRNPFYTNMIECKYEKMKDYYYCQEWISTEFKVDNSTIEDSIKKEYNKTTTTVSYELNDKDSNFVTFLELYIKYRIYILVGLGIGIVADIIYIYLSYKKIKDAEF